MKKLFALLMALACGVAANAYTFRVMINAENFPDANFRAFLLSQPWGVNGYVDDPQTITSMDCSGKNISSLVGIEFFHQLKTLDCSNNNLTILPSNDNGTFDQTLHELVTLKCGQNKFKTLSLPELQASTVDVSGCQELESLDLPGWQVRNLNCYNCLKLSRISLPLGGADGALVELLCSGCTLPSLDLSNFDDLQSLDCSTNRLTHLTVSDKSALQRLNISVNDLKDSGMDDFVASLPTRDEPTQFRVKFDNDGNDMTTYQVAAAKAKNWVPMEWVDGNWVEMTGIEPAVPAFDRLTPYSFIIPDNALDNTGNEGYAKLFDGNMATKWCVVNTSGSWQTISVDFMSNKPFIPKSYSLVTAKDTQSYPNRNPKKWRLYGKKDIADEWTQLHGVNGNILEGVNNATYNFPFDNDKEYQFFRFEVLGVGSIEDGNYIFQLAELGMEGLPGSGNEPSPSKFDVNGDGSVDVGDVNAVLGAILDGDTSEKFDVNGDGNVDVGDVNAVLECILNGGPADDNKMTVTAGGVSFKMVQVKGGTFLMGSTHGRDYYRYDEEPVHLVTLSDYWIGETEVTEALWTAVMGRNPSLFKLGDNYPVDGVSYKKILEFISNLNTVTGLTFALPTEAQWEFAARGGTLSRDFLYAGSDDFDEVAWIRDNSNSKKHEVATKKPNELGLYDMSGNLWEWCADWYGEYNSEMATDPVGPETGDTRVMRGGAFNLDFRTCRPTARFDNYDGTGGSSYGLRLVLVNTPSQIPANK